MYWCDVHTVVFARRPCPPNRWTGWPLQDWHKFKKLLASKTFAVHDTQRMRGEDLTAKWATESGFREPVIAVDKTGMGLKVMMADTSSAASVAHPIGGRMRIVYLVY